MKFKQGDIIKPISLEQNGPFYEVIMMSRPYPKAELEVVCLRVDDPREDFIKERYYLNPDLYEKLREHTVVLKPTWTDLGDFATRTNFPELDGKAQLDGLEDKMVTHPDHYTAGGIETRDYIKAKLNAMPFLTPFQAYCLGTAMKYQPRAGLKDRSKFKQDLEKSITYTRWAFEDEKV